MHFALFVCVLLYKLSAGYQAKTKESVSKVSKTVTYSSSPIVTSTVKASKSSFKTPETSGIISPSKKNPLKESIYEELESSTLSVTSTFTRSSSLQSVPHSDFSKPTKISAKERKNAFVILFFLIWNIFFEAVQTFIWTIIPLFERLNYIFLLIIFPPIGLICAFLGGFIELLTIFEGIFASLIIWGGLCALKKKNTPKSANKIKGNNPYDEENEKKKISDQKSSQIYCMWGLVTSVFFWSCAIFHDNLIIKEFFRSVFLSMFCCFIHFWIYYVYLFDFSVNFFHPRRTLSQHWVDAKLFFLPAKTFIINLALPYAIFFFACFLSLAKDFPASGFASYSKQEASIQTSPDNLQGPSTKTWSTEDEEMVRILIARVEKNDDTAFRKILGVGTKTPKDEIKKRYYDVLRSLGAQRLQTNHSDGFTTAFSLLQKAKDHLCD